MTQPIYHSLGRSFPGSFFFQIFGALHVGDLDSTTKRDKIQPLLDRLCPAFEAAYTLLSIHEACYA